MTTLYTRDQSMVAIRAAFETTRALRFNESDHLANLVVEVYDRLPAGLGQQGTLAAFIDGFCAASTEEMRRRDLDFVYRVGGVLYGGTGSDLRTRTDTGLIPAALWPKVEVAFLWHGSEEVFIGWHPLGDLTPKVQL